LPVLNQLAEQYSERGVLVLAMNIDGGERGYKEFIRSNPYPYLHWARDGSGAIRKAYSVGGVPTTYIVDGEGIVRYAQVGYGSGMQEVLAQELDALFE
jgi:Redoxin